MENLEGGTDEIVLYTTPWCPFCINAKRLLGKKGASYRDVDVSRRQDVRAELLALTGSRTVPQIFIGGKPVGGFDDLYALDRKGELDPMLAAVQATSK